MDNFNPSTRRLPAVVAPVKVTPHSQAHEWRDRSDDGRLRIVRAQWDSRKWSFTETYKDIPTWHALTAPPLADYEKLRDVLWRKYQEAAAVAALSRTSTD